MQQHTTEKHLYQVVAVEKIDTPDGMDGNNWYRYLIQRKGSAIDGMKSGTLNSVTLHAESVASDLNDRIGGRSVSAYATRRRTAAT
ncbi:MAG: hypothetical protein OEZ16_02325 [Chromatiales bacterium]|nr:hypothetical protein [Chromatiales bacterium]